MRSSGGTNFGLERSVVARTKSTIACFAGPSFHEASVFAASCARAVLVRPAGSAGKTARVASNVRRLIPQEETIDFMVVFLLCTEADAPVHLFANQHGSTRSNSCE